MQQIIINILHKTYNMTYNVAYKYLYEHMTIPDKKIITILEGLIKDSEGIDVIINRNPIISLGSICAMKCIGIEYNYTMSMPTNILKGLAADFDKQNCRLVEKSTSENSFNCWKIYV